VFVTVEIVAGAEVVAFRVWFGVGMSGKKVLSQRHRPKTREKASVTGSLKGAMFRMLLLPVLLSLRPKAERWLSDWVRRKLTGALAFLASAVGAGAAATEHYIPAIVAGVVALVSFGLELAASWALHEAASGDEEATE
jgi:hypothetical protein